MVSKIKHPWATKGLVNIQQNDLGKWEFNNPECGGLYFGDALNRIIRNHTYTTAYGYAFHRDYLTNFLKTYCNDF